MATTTLRCPVSGIARGGAAVLAGAAGHLGVLAAGFGLLAWENSRITAGCEATDCQPQYYAFSGFLYVLVGLPLTYLAGSALILAAWAVASRTWPFSLRRRLLVRVTIVLIASPLLILAGAFEVRRLPAFVAAVIVVPVLLAAIAATATALGRTGAPTADPPWPDPKPPRAYQ